MSQEIAHGVALDALFPSARRSGPAGAFVTNCTSDWRQVRPGDAYVAVLDENADGHDFAARAVELGAAAIVAEQLVPVFGVPQYEVEDSRIALGELCHALAEHPSRRMKVIGVVGDHGKSTVIAVLESIFVKAGCQVGVISSLGCYDGMSVSPGVASVISPAALVSRLANMDAAGCDCALVEISSQGLSQQCYAGLELDGVIATRIDSARLDVHRTTQNYRDAQRRVLDLLSPWGLAAFDANDQVSCRWLSNLDAASITFGLCEHAQVRASIVEQNNCETVFVLDAGCESAAIRTTIVGEAHVSNCLAAAAMALSHGIDLQTIAAGIEAVERLPARMERLECGQDFAVYIDAARTPGALRAALRTARQLARGRVICVLGEAPRAAAEATIVRSVVEKLADLAIAAVGRDLAASAPSTPGDRATICAAGNRSEAIAWAVAVAGPGDVVVIAGSQGRGQAAFGEVCECEADMTRDLLYARARPALRLVG